MPPRKKAAPTATPKPPANHAEIPLKAYQALMSARAQISEWEKVIEVARGQIEDAMGDAEYGDINGTTVIEFKVSKRRALSQKLLDQLYPAIKEECMETTETRRFVPKTDVDPSAVG